MAPENLIKYIKVVDDQPLQQRHHANPLGANQEYFFIPDPNKPPLAGVVFLSAQDQQMVDEIVEAFFPPENFNL